jgi:hypothetical protein
MDLTLNLKNFSDESLVQQDGSVQKFKRYDFYLGKFGPFTERVPLEGFNDALITARVNALKQHLLALPK